VFHDGNNSYVKDSGTGDLVLQGTNNIWLQHGNGENSLKATQGGAVELRYANSPKFTTSTIGATVSGVLKVEGTTGQMLNLNATDDADTYLAWQRSGSRVGYIGYGSSNNDITFRNEIDGGNIVIKTNEGGTTLQLASFDNGVHLYASDGDRKFRTTSSGAICESATGDTYLQVVAEENASNADAYLRLKTNHTQAIAGIQFGDTDDTDIGKILYRNSTNKLEFTTNTQLALAIDSSQNAIFSGTLQCGNNTDISPSSSGAGHLMIDANGYTGYIAADATAMYLGQNSSSRSLTLQTNETDALTISGSQKVLIGKTTATNTRLGTNNFSPEFQIQGQVGGQGATSFTRFQTGNAPYRVVLQKARGTADSPATILNGDYTSQLLFSGHDGTNWANVGAIYAAADGTVSTGSMPGRIEFRTTKLNEVGASEAMRIDASQRVGIGHTSPDARLTIGNFNGTGLRLRGSGGAYQGMSLMTTDSSASVTRNIFIDATNETGVTVANQVAEIASDGSSHWRWDTQPASAGNRADRRQTRMKLSSNGRLLLGSSTEYSTNNCKLEVGNNASGQIQVGRPNNHWASGVTFLNVANYGQLDTHGAYEVTLTAGGYRKIVNGVSSWEDYTVNGESGYAAQIALNPTNGNILFRTESGMSSGDSTSINTRMMITSSGKVLVGTTTDQTTNGSGYIQAAVAGANLGGWRSDSGTATTRQHMRFANTNGVVGSIATVGSATAFNTTSDYRLKENEVAISDGITRLKTLKPYRFNFKADSSTTVDGFFAHEVTAVPEATIGQKDDVVTQAMIDSGDYKAENLNDPIYQGIDQSKLVPLLTAALQEAITKIETLETKVAALESS